jgi:hypothetical protein
MLAQTWFNWKKAPIQVVLMIAIVPVSMIAIATARRIFMAPFVLH